MAIYHLSVKPLSRSTGRSATAAAAYRSAGRIEDATTGETFDYTRKRGVEHAEIVLPTDIAKQDINWPRDRQALWNAAAYRSAGRIEDTTTGEIFDYTRKQGVEHTEIVLPSDAAKQDINWPRDRQALWNAAEQAENRKDARVAREYEVALPAELTKAQHLALTREFALELANRYGNAVDFAIHRPHWSGDERNHHAHILTTTRKVETTGLGAKTDIELKDVDRAKKGLGPAKKEIVEIRERWAALSNEHLERAGHKARIDHRTLEAQGITDRKPTVHLGPAVQGVARRGKDSVVLERIAGQQAEDARHRLERAAELGRLERERVEIQRSILVLDSDIRSALATRDTLSNPARAPTPEEQRQQAREKWAGLQNGKDLGRALGAANAPSASVSHGLEGSRGTSTYPLHDEGADRAGQGSDGGLAR